MAALTGRVAIVTGAARGIGQGIAWALAAAGAAVVVADQAEGTATVAQIQAQGGQSFWVQADVACEAEVAALVATAVSTYGRLDIVVNNAGVVAVQTVEESSVEDWDRPVRRCPTCVRLAAALCSTSPLCPALWPNRGPLPTAPARGRC
jgi:NAD(P)-dependent dehydrogenase (short-subunit alcohol dehydrogenase family)